MQKKSASGTLTTFSGIFGTAELSLQEKDELDELLKRFSTEACDPEADLKLLSLLTVEVKAINNQAALLHGERIKKAQTLLKAYREGAFTAWLLKVYGNRQTPYNFLQYYEFYLSVSKELHPLIESMPRKIVYTLATREGPIEKKEWVVKEAAGKSKQQILSQIREYFPLKESDKRAHSPYLTLLHTLRKTLPLLSSTPLNQTQKETLASLISKMQEKLR